jgi:hypothetical protein
MQEPTRRAVRICCLRLFAARPAKKFERVMLFDLCQGSARKRHVGPQRAHSGNAWTPVMNWTANNTALTVMMPPNPVTARMLSTATFPLEQHDDCVGRDICSKGSKSHGKVPEMLVLTNICAAIH